MILVSIPLYVPDFDIVPNFVIGFTWIWIGADGGVKERHTVIHRYAGLRSAGICIIRKEFQNVQI